MSRTPKITRVARHIRDTYAIPLTTGKVIAQALHRRGWLDDDREDAIQYLVRTVHMHEDTLTVAQAVALLEIESWSLSEPTGLLVGDSAGGPVYVDLSAAAEPEGIAGALGQGRGYMMKRTVWDDLASMDPTRDGCTTRAPDDDSGYGPHPLEQGQGGSGKSVDPTRLWARIALGDGAETVLVLSTRPLDLGDDPRVEMAGRDGAAAAVRELLDRRLAGHSRPALIAVHASAASPELFAEIHARRDQLRETGTHLHWGGAPPLKLSGTPGFGKTNAPLIYALRAVEQHPQAQVHYLVDRMLPGPAAPMESLPARFHLYDTTTDPEAVARFTRDVTAELTRREEIVKAGAISEPLPPLHVMAPGWAVTGLGIMLPDMNVQVSATMDEPGPDTWTIPDFRERLFGGSQTPPRRDISPLQLFVDEYASLPNSEELHDRITEILRAGRSLRLHTFDREPEHGPALILSTEPAQYRWPGARVYDGNDTAAIAEFIAALRVEVERREAEADRTGAHVADQILVLVEGVRGADHPDLSDLIRRCSLGRLLGIMMIARNDQWTQDGYAAPSWGARTPHELIAGGNGSTAYLLAAKLDQLRQRELDGGADGGDVTPESGSDFRLMAERVLDPERRGPNAAVIRPVVSRILDGVAGAAADRAGDVSSEPGLDLGSVAEEAAQMFGPRAENAHYLEQFAELGRASREADYFRFVMSMPGSGKSTPHKLVLGDSSGKTSGRPAAVVKAMLEYDPDSTVIYLGCVDGADSGQLAGADTYDVHLGAHAYTSFFDRLDELVSSGFEALDAGKKPGLVLAIVGPEANLPKYLDDDPDRASRARAVVSRAGNAWSAGVRLWVEVPPADTSGTTEREHRDRLYPQTDHHVEVATDGTLTFSCTAQVGAPCREVCANGCEEYHARDCDRNIVDGGECNALIWLNTADTVLEDYSGEQTDPAEWTSGPIETWWSAYYETWLWRFAGEGGDAPSLHGERS